MSRNFLYKATCLECSTGTRINSYPMDRCIDSPLPGIVEIRCPICGNGMGHLEWHGTGYRFIPKPGTFYDINNNTWVIP
jgi:hypothetical protein